MKKNYLLIIMLLALMGAAPYLSSAWAADSSGKILPLFPTLDNSQISLLLVKPNPNDKNLTSDQKASLKKLNKKIDGTLTKISDGTFNSMATDLIQSLMKGDNTKALKNTAAKLKQSLNQTIDEIKDDLPKSDPLIYTAYLLPWKRGDVTGPVLGPNLIGTPPKINATNSSIQVEQMQLPMFIVEPQNEAGVAWFAGEQNTAIRTMVSSANAIENNFYMAVAVMQIKLQQNKNEVQVQMLSGVTPKDYTFLKDNGKVSIQKIIVPKPEKNEDRMMALLSLHIPLYEGIDGAPGAKIEFGSYGGINGGSYGHWLGSLQVYRTEVPWGEPDDLCISSFKGALYTMALEGQLKPGAIENKFIQRHFGPLLEKLHPIVKFRIFDMVFDVEKFLISHMTIRLDVFTDLKNFSCLDQKSVEEEFRDDFNENLQELLGVRDEKSLDLAVDALNFVYSQQ